MALLALLAVAWLALLITAPLLPLPIAGVLYAIGSRICHQLPARSFHLFGSQLPVCGRCLGMYGGAAAGAVIATIAGRGSPLMKAVPRMLLLLGGAPTALTLALEWSGAWNGSNAWRAAAGVPLGAAVALVMMQAAATLHYSGQPGRDIGAASRFSRRTYQ